MTVAAVVLAAGSGSRFGGTKQLERLHGRPLVRHVVEAARGAGLREVVVVVGHDADAVAEAAGRDARVVRNPRFEEGQSTSIAAGLDALGNGVEAAVILLADQPAITSGHVRALLDAFGVRPEPILRLRFVDGPGPALLRREIWDEVRSLRGDVGARALIERRPDLVFETSIATDAPVDVDTREDLERVAERAPPGAGHEKPPSL